MRPSPSIAPENADVVYLVMDDLGGRLGRTWRETDEDDRSRDPDPRPPGWAVSLPSLDRRLQCRRGLVAGCDQEIADELWERCAGEVPASLQDFLDRYPERPKAQQLRLRL